MYVFMCVIDQKASNRRFYEILTLILTLTKMTKKHQQIVMNLKAENFNYPHFFLPMIIIENDRNNEENSKFELEQSNFLNCENKSMIEANALCITLALIAFDSCCCSFDSQ